MSEKETRRKCQTNRGSCLARVQDSFECEKCHKVFNSFSGYATHKKWKHDNPRIYECTECETRFKNSFVLRRHVANAHKGKPACYNCPLCDFRGNKRKINKHFQELHGLDLNVLVNEFQSIEDFNDWKKRIEYDTWSKYVKHRSPRSLKDGTIIATFHCHRDGTFNSRGKQIRNLKTLGSNKINAHCPSEMEVRIKDNRVTVAFTQTHVGHTNDLSRLTLTKEEKESIVRQLSMRVPIDDILDSIRDSLAGTDLKRIHLATKKDLHNIIEQYKLDKEAVLQKNNFTDLDSWVKHMEATSNLIRFYKPQGDVLSAYPDLHSDDLCLIVANDSQLELLKWYGDDVLCLDSISSSGIHNADLYTILVMDNLEQGFPCAFMFCNRMDEITTEIFFKVVQTTINSSLLPRYFISDISEVYYNGWLAANPKGDAKQLFCSWHVDRVWRCNLKTIRGDEKQLEVYKMLKVLMFERDVSAFQEIGERFLAELFSDPVTSSFGTYVEQFLNDPSVWAHCYVTECRAYANTSLENLHQHLKYLYTKGKKTKGLDKRIHALMKFTKDRLYNRQVVGWEKEGPKSSSAATIRHKASIELPESLVQQLNEKTWNVYSPDKKESFVISTSNLDCKCTHRCPECKCCIHSFNCTCLDATVSWNVCKHIHLLCRVLGPTTSQQAETKQTTLAKKKVVILERLVNLLNSIRTESGLEALNQKLSEIESTVITAEVSELSPEPH